MSNPVLSAETFAQSARTDAPAMTLEGVRLKSAGLVGLVIVAAVLVWNHVAVFMPYLLPVALAAFAVGVAVAFVPRSAPYLAPLYAVLEGLVIGTVSTYFEADFPGIVIQAVSLTFATFIMMLWLYRGRILQATERFRRGVFAATGAIAIVYLVSIVGSISGWYSVPYIHESGMLGIGFSLFAVGTAALNLIIDFDDIEAGVRGKAAKYLEWYAAFGLMVTLVWLYLEILRLLSKLRSK